MTKIVSIFKFLLVKLFKQNVKIKGLTPRFIGLNAIIKTRKKGQIIFKHKFRIDKNAEIFSSGLLQIGEHFVLNPYSRIIAHEKIIIGDNVTIARFVSILDHDHAYCKEGGNLKLQGYNTQPIILGNNIWIGDKVSINKGVTIGNNVIIGANSVVTKDIPSNCIAAGVPCKIIRNI
jgi:maltose O-acetyltransferase